MLQASTALGAPVKTWKGGGGGSRNTVRCWWCASYWCHVSPESLQSLKSPNGTRNTHAGPKSVVSNLGSAQRKGSARKDELPLCSEVPDRKCFWAMRPGVWYTQTLHFTDRAAY